MCWVEGQLCKPNVRQPKPQRENAQLNMYDSLDHSGRMRSIL